MKTEITGSESPRVMSIRQHFAAMAMQGLLANSIDTQQGVEPFWYMCPDKLAACAVGYADSLIQELNKAKGTNS